MSKTAEPPHGNTIHPWVLWQNGHWHTVLRGTHFDSKPEVFRRILFQVAKRSELKVITRVKDTAVTFRFYSPKPAKPKQSRKKKGI